MKRILCIFVISLLFIVSFQSVQAADSYLAMNGFTFDINDSGEAVIHEYDDRATDVMIPDRLLGAPVVKIDDYAFFADENMTSVSFESASGLKIIGDSAFYGCTGLENLTLCASLEELGFGAFQNCTNLKTLVIENGLTAIPEQAFYGDTALTSVSVPDSVTEIAAKAFDNCEGLVIYCTKESYALQFAIANSIDYVITNPEPQPVPYILGDVDLDGHVSISDVTCIQSGIAESEPLSDLQIRLADVDNDGLDIADATRIQRFLAEYDDPYHIGEEVEYDEDGLTFIPSYTNLH